MSEMKCPCCGSEASDFEQTGIIECEECQFMCDITDFQRISAAMDLARCVADSWIDWNEDHAKWLYDETKRAREKVMEAFK